MFGRTIVGIIAGSLAATALAVPVSAILYARDVPLVPVQPQRPVREPLDHDPREVVPGGHVLPFERDDAVAQECVGTTRAG